MNPVHLGLFALLPVALLPAAQETPAPLAPLDIFELERATDPQVAPDGSGVVYVRSGFNIMTDRTTSEIWHVNAEGHHRPWIQEPSRSPRWSPSGDRLAYLALAGGKTQIHVRWNDTGETARLSRLTSGPGSLSWSPDGRRLAFSMFVEGSSPSFVSAPAKPEGAQWAPAPKVITSLKYRSDGGGYTEPGHSQLFLLSADGGTPRQVTSGPHDHGGPYAWHPSSEYLVLSANRREDAEYEPNDSELYRVDLASGELTALTDRYGPDRSPVFSPDGSQLAWLGFDDRYQGYQLNRLNVMDVESGEVRELSSDFDRSLGGLKWAGDWIYAQWDDQETSKIGAFSPEGGEPRELVQDLGGLSVGRPYSGGSYSVSPGGTLAYTRGDSQSLADVAVVADGETQRLTDLNRDLFANRDLAPIEELWTPSSHDELPIQAWIARPPGFDPAKKYPLLLEIHGGPFANYGARFSAEVQLYAAAGYVVVYANPRGSTGYGESFGNAIHHAYPGYDYFDLMSVVDAVIAQGSIDEERLYVTGGSGGGVLTAWIVGKTDRFRAAVVAKPVIHWTSFALTADSYNFFYRYWFPGLPWDFQQQYWDRSPLSLVGNVTTPTMLLTGEADYRTPISESEQYYQALKLCKVETAMVRIPEASHSIASRPSHLIAKVAHILAWFDKYGGEDEE